MPNNNTQCCIALNIQLDMKVLAVQMADVQFCLTLAYGINFKKAILVADSFLIGAKDLYMRVRQRHIITAVSDISFNGIIALLSVTQNTDLPHAYEQAPEFFIQWMEMLWPLAVNDVVNCPEFKPQLGDLY